MTTLKIAAFAPMASASVATTTSVKPGARARLRAACVKSLIQWSINLSRGFAPRTSPTRALARRFDGSLRSRGSLAVLARTYFSFAASFAFAASILAPRRRRRAQLSSFTEGLASLPTPPRATTLPRELARARDPLHGRVLARRFAGSLRARGSLAALARAYFLFAASFAFAASILALRTTPSRSAVIFYRGASPLGLPYIRLRAKALRRDLAGARRP